MSCRQTAKVFMYFFGINIFFAGYLVDNQQMGREEVCSAIPQQNNSENQIAAKLLRNGRD